MTQLTLARPEHLDPLLRLVSDCHHEAGITLGDAARRAALLALLEGSPHGAVYLAGPVRAPIGHVAISFGWSVAGGGLGGIIDEIYVRPGVRGRGIGTELLQTLPKTLARAGVKAIHLEIGGDDPRARRLGERAGFRLAEGRSRISRRL